MIQYLNPIQWMRWFGQFVYFWAISIPWKNISHGIPAILLCAALATLGFFAFTDGGSWRRNLIKEELSNAVLSEDFETADLLLRRQLEGGDQTAETLFAYAENLDRQEKADEAITMMRQLAFERRNDAAAMWLVRKLYEGKSWQELKTDDRREFGKLLALLNQSRPDNLGIKQLYANYLIADERYSSAIPHLVELAERAPGLGLQAAALAKRVGEDEMSSRLANTTLERLSKRHEEEPANPGLALGVSQAHVFLDQHDQAVRTLADSIDRMKKPEHRQALRQAMGDTLAAWINKIESEPNETATDQLRILKMLQVALQYAPNNPRVLTLVANQVLQTIESDEEEVISIRNALVKGSSPGIAHFVRGTAALVQGRTETAEKHLKLASSHLPNSAAILNNLAVALSQREDGDLEHALQLSEQAIATVDRPGPYFYETRGQILYRMERYLDAIPDLERALAADALAANAHQTLANCYAEIDEPELSQDHQEAADRLQSDN
ncbi:hypothetical protein [Rhodopirellula sallentina]|uniref:Uncharacterized protein n=1 Tax=Rhodopirellula sallentina SM41 TaxID=1263870 RepID=M5UKQ3_9BACT|nr:hypothetical protein [Rhodopirellula sallentina]EMI56593.1 hypothetical protein RSSM_01969 [Rhodopirellula sallentina SM41]